MPHSGHVFWLFGLSGAGKSTLADLLSADLRKQQLPVLSLDGDVLRAGLCAGLSFSDAERAENLRRAAEVAKLGIASGLCVIASFITPLEAHRLIIAKVIGSKNLSFIHLNAPLSVCRERDVKGLYARAKQGKISQMTGVSSPFEIPTTCDLQIDTAALTTQASVSLLAQFANQRLKQAASPDTP